MFFANHRRDSRRIITAHSPLAIARESTRSGEFSIYILHIRVYTFVVRSKPPRRAKGDCVNGRQLNNIVGRESNDTSARALQQPRNVNWQVCVCSTFCHLHHDARHDTQRHAVHFRRPSIYISRIWLVCMRVLETAIYNLYICII